MPFALARRRLAITAATAVACLAGPAVSDAQEEARTFVEADWFPYAIPSLADDATTGSAIDLSYLSPEPAGSSGHLRARDDGEIVDGEGNVIKLFGTNICDWHAMPAKELARPIAQRLRQLGVNFIRLHYYDWTVAPEGMMQADMKTVDPAKLDEFHHLIAELAEAGIYVDVNLHVARHYPGAPSGFHMSKGVDRVSRPLIEDQKSFARQVLASPNPHRDGQTLAEDPAVAIVEINNENSLMRDFWTRVGSLPPDVVPGLREGWNQFLLDRYGDTDALRQAWDGDLIPEGDANLIVGGVAALGVEASNNGTSSFEQGDGAAQWTVVTPGGEGWSHQLHVNDLPVRDGDRVVLRLRYRATQPLGIRLMKGGGSWVSVSGAPTLPASDDWQDVAISWTVDDDEPNIPTRLSFDAFNEVGTYEIQNLALRRGELPGLDVGQSLESASVPPPGLTGNGRALADWRDYCEQLELAYTAEMSAFLRDELNVQAMLLDTQVDYGGGVGLVRETRHSDLIDIHGYPTHPQNLTVDGQRAFRVEQKSTVGDAFEGLAKKAFWQVARMPAGVSEWDVNPPQDYNSESYPLLALLTAYQGWDMLGEYAWLNFQGSYEPESLEHPYHTTGNPAQIVFMPMAALTFRLGLIEPAGHALTLQLGEDHLLDASLGWDAIDGAWQNAGVGAASAFRQRLLLDVQPGDAEPLLLGEPMEADERGLIVSDTGQLTLDRREQGGEVLTVNAPALKAAFGHTLDHSFDLGGVGITVTEAGARPGTYANVALVSLDGKPIDQSAKLLLTTVARVHGEGWRFLDEERTLVTFGPGPMRAEPVGVTLSLPGGTWRMTPLDGTGRPMGDGRVGTTFDTRGLRSLWFLLEPADPR